MATITLTAPVFYKAGSSGVSQVVGFESKATRVVRYQFTAPSTGASGLTVTLAGITHSKGQAIALRYHITESATSHADPSPTDPYTGTLQSGKATANCLLLPGKTYYLWVFPAVTVYGWYSWGGVTGTLTTTGGSRSTISATGGDLGQPISITIQANAPFTHKLTWKFGTRSGTLSGTTWTPELSLAQEIPNSRTGTAQLTCQTFDGTTCIGSHTIPVTLQVPDTQAPELELQWPYPLIQHLDPLGLELKPKPTWGATIVGSRVLLDGKVYRGEVLTKSGILPLTVVIVDSRGLSKTVDTQITVEAYQLPTLTLAAHRCDADGTANDSGEYAQIQVTGKVSTLSGNTAKLTLQAGTQSFQPSVQPGTISYSTIVPVASTQTLDIQAELADSHRSVQRSLVLSVGYATMDFLAGGKGVAFGTTATKEGMSCNMEVDMCGKRIANLQYPNTETGAAVRAQALPYRGSLITAANAFQGVYRHKDGVLVQLGTTSCHIQLFCNADGLQVTYKAE